MKKGLILSTAGVLAAVMAVTLVVTKVFSAPSRYEGKIVKEIEFIGIKKLGGDKEETVALRSLKGMTLLKDEYTSNNLVGAGKPQYDAIYLNQPFAQSKVKDTIRLLFEKGNLYDARVEVQESGDGVKVRIFCEERPSVSQIVFKGLDKVQETDLRDKMMLKTGDAFRQDLLDKSLPAIRKRYFEAGLANCVLKCKVEQDKKKKDGSVMVTILVDEGESIKVQKITVLGAKKIPEYELRGVLSLKEEGPFSQGDYKQDVFREDKEKILMYYRQNGYLDAEFVDEENQISYEWNDPEANEDRARSIYITLKISEGERYYFDGYRITGVTGTVGSKEKGTLITKERVEAGLELMPQSASVVDNLSGALGVDDDTDVVFDNTLFEKDRHGIAFLYAGQGHVFARVTPTKKIEEREKVIGGKKVKRKYVSYDLDVFEGGEAHIEKIFIRGCKKTKEYVVRREVLMKEDVNELFDSYKVQRTREILFNLGYFKEVNIEMRPGSAPDKVNILIDVEEQSTGSISLGGGYGTTSGFSIFATLGDKNFLGRGENAQIKVEYGPQKTNLTLSYTIPWLFGYPVSLETAVYYSLTKYSTTSLFESDDDYAYYKMQTFGYYVGPSYQFWYYYGVSLLWDQSWSSIVNPDGSCKDEIFKQQKLGLQEERKIRARFSRNTIDNAFYPTRGTNSVFSISFVGGPIIGGNSHFVKYEPGVDLYYTPFHLPFLDKYPCVIELRGSGEFITPPFNRGAVQRKQDRFYNDWVKSGDRVYIGGPPGMGTNAVLRGWDSTSDPLPESWQYGLYHCVTYGAEFRVPLQPQYVWFVLFFDAGAAFTDRFWSQTLSESDALTASRDKKSGNLRDIRDITQSGIMSYFRYSYGFGFKIQIPMMPLRFWFAQKALWNGRYSAPLKDLGGLTFQFSIGDISL